ncbi:hypothetical protein BRDID11002_08730 [Bradyrhizobium diazoefficiens]
MMDSIVADAGRLEKRNEPGKMAIGMVEHAGEGCLQAREDAALVRGMLLPGLHAVVARGHPRCRRHEAHRPLARQALLPFDVPAVREGRVVAPDDIGGRLMRRMAGAQRDPGEPGNIRPVGDVIADEADRLVDQVLGQVIAVGIGARRINVRVVRDELRRILVGLGIEEAVETIKTTPERPAVERAGGAALGQRGDVPLADHVVAIAVHPQHLGERPRLARDLAAIAGIAGIEIGKAPDADRMVVAPGEQRRTRRRAHRRGVEAGIAQALRSEPVDGRRLDGRSVAAEIGEADIVEQHDEDVRRALWRPRCLRPPGFGLRNRLADGAAERRAAACAHLLLPACCVNRTVDPRLTTLKL